MRSLWQERITRDRRPLSGNVAIESARRMAGFRSRAVNALASDLVDTTAIEAALKIHDWAAAWAEKA
jgi:hypothetical protein